MVNLEEEKQLSLRERIVEEVFYLVKIRQARWIMLKKIFKGFLFRHS